MSEVDIISPVQVGHIPDFEWEQLQQLCTELVETAPDEGTKMSEAMAGKIDSINVIFGRHMHVGPGANLRLCTRCTIKRPEERDSSTRFSGVVYKLKGVDWYNEAKISGENSTYLHTDGVEDKDGLAGDGLAGDGTSAVSFSVAIPATGVDGSSTPQTLIYPYDTLQWDPVGVQIRRKAAGGAAIGASLALRAGDIINNSAVVHSAPKGTNRLFIRMTFTGENLLHAKVNLLVSNLRF